jgi:hypothetical protein
MASADYFRVLPQGFACAACDKTFTGTFAKQDARRCCHDLKPLSKFPLKQADQLLLELSYTPTPRLDKGENEGITAPDRWGHRRRGQSEFKGALSLPQIFAEYHRARQAIALEMFKAQAARLGKPFAEAIDHAFGDDWDARGRRTTPRQRTAYHALNPKPFAAGGNLVAARVAVAKAEGKRGKL